MRIRGRRRWGGLRGAVVVCALVSLFAGTAVSAPSAAAKSRTLGKVTSVGQAVRVPVGRRLVVLPYVSYRVGERALRRLGARRRSLRALYTARIISEPRRGHRRTLIRLVRGVRRAPLFASRTRRANPRALLRLPGLILSRGQTRRIKLAARRGRVVIAARAGFSVRFRNARGRIEVRDGAPASQTRAVSSGAFLAQGKPPGVVGSDVEVAVENRFTGLLVWDPVVGKYAGPITRTGNRNDNQKIYFQQDKWIAYMCVVGCFGPKGEVYLSVGSTTAPALTVTEGYNELWNAPEPHIYCRVLAGAGTNLTPTCAVDRTHASLCIWMPESSVGVPPNTCDVPAVDTYFITAPGICNVSGVTCSEPATNTPSLAKSERNDLVWSMTGVFVYDAIAQKFAGPTARTGSKADTGDINLTGDADKWAASHPNFNSSGYVFYKYPRGSVTLSVGSATVGSPARVPLKITASYNEEDTSKPRIACSLDAVSYYKLAPTCLPNHVDVPIHYCPESGCKTAPMVSNTYFVRAPGICGVEGVTCSAIPPFYSPSS